MICARALRLLSDLAHCRHKLLQQPLSLYKHLDVDFAAEVPTDNAEQAVINSGALLTVRVVCSGYFGYWSVTQVQNCASLSRSGKPVSLPG